MPFRESSPRLKAKYQPGEVAFIHDRVGDVALELDDNVGLSRFPALVETVNFLLRLPDGTVVGDGNSYLLEGEELIELIESPNLADAEVRLASGRTYRHPTAIAPLLPLTVRYLPPAIEPADVMVD